VGKNWAAAARAMWDRQWHELSQRPWERIAQAKRDDPTPLAATGKNSFGKALRPNSTLLRCLPDASGSGYQNHRRTPLLGTRGSHASSPTVAIEADWRSRPGRCGTVRDEEEEEQIASRAERPTATGAPSPPFPTVGAAAMASRAPPKLSRTPPAHALFTSLVFSPPKDVGIWCSPNTLKSLQILFP
jgi:hypothetical protein